MASTAQAAQFQSFWESASQKYRERAQAAHAAKVKKRFGIGHKHVDLPPPPPPTSLSELKERIEEECGGFEEFRGKRQSIFHGLDNLMKPVEMVGKLAGGAAGVAFPPSSCIFGGVAFLIGAAREVSAKYDAITELFERAGQITTRFKIYNEVPFSPELRDIVEGNFVTLMEIFDVATDAVKHEGRFLAFGKSLLGPGSQAQGLLDKLDKQTSHEQSVVLAEVHTTVAKSGAELNRVGKVSDSTNAKVTELHNRFIKDAEETRAQREQKDREKIQSALDPYSTNWNAVRGTLRKLKADMLKGTCKWIMKEQSFREWVRGVQPILVLSGGGGTGKSTLAAHIISRLLERHPQGSESQDSSRVSVAYFFCQSDKPNLRSLDNVLKTVAWQITENDPVFQNTILNLASKEGSLDSRWDLWDAMKEFFAQPDQPDTTYVIIDGVDHIVKEHLHDMFTSFLQAYMDEEEKPRIRLLLVAQSEFVTELEEFEGRVLRCHILAEKNAADIKAFAESSVAKKPKLRKPSLKNDIVDTLSKSAEGMFVYVSLMVKELGDQGLAKDIREKLKTAPSGLANVLRLPLERFADSHEPHTSRYLNLLLDWVVCACRALTLGELNFVVIIEEGEKMLLFERTLRTDFSSFFALARPDGKTTDQLRAIAQRKRFEAEGDEESDSEGGILATATPEESTASGEDEEDEDEDEDEDFESPYATTTIELKPSSFAQFFRQHGKVEGKVTHEKVGVDFQEAELRLAKTCLKLICDDGELSNQTPKDGSSLFMYAATYFDQHLANLDISRVDVETKRLIVSYLVKIFTDEDTIDKWFFNTNFTQEWIMEEVHVNNIRKWFADKEAISLMSQHDLDWINETAEGMDPKTAFAAALLKPTSIYMAKQWLVYQTSKWGMAYCCITVINYMISIGVMKPDEKVPDFTADPNTLGPQRILDASVWPQFEENALFHHRVALVLRDSRFIDEAIPNFEKAIALDPGLAVAYRGLAIALGDQKQEHRKAIELALKAQELCVPLGDSYKDVDVDCVLAIVRWRDALEETEAATETFEKAMERYPDDLWMVSLYVTRMSQNKHYDKIIACFESLESRGCLTEYLVTYASSAPNLLDFIRKAARVTQKLEFVQTAYAAAIKNAKKKKLKPAEIALRTSLAYLYSRGLKDEDKAIALWQRIVAEDGDAVSSDDIMLDAMDMLCEAHFARALAAEAGSNIYETNLVELEKLCKRKVDSEDGNEVFGDKSEKWVYSTRGSGLMLGLLYRLKGRTEDAKQCFREHVRLAMDLLSDDDDDNDWSAFYKLGSTLFKWGDYENGKAAWMLFYIEEERLGKAAEEEEEEPGNGGDTKEGEEAKEGVEDAPTTDESTSPSESAGAQMVEDGEKKDLLIRPSSSVESPSTGTPEQTEGVAANKGEPAETPWRWHGCDGPCDLTPGYFPAGCYFCTYCLAVQWCDSCINLVRKDELPYKLCSPQHEFVYVVGPPKGLEKGKVVVSGKVRDVKEWLNELRVEWGIPLPSSKAEKKKPTRLGSVG